MFAFFLVCSLSRDLIYCQVLQAFLRVPVFVIIITLVSPLHHTYSTSRLTHHSVTLHLTLSSRSSTLIPPKSLLRPTSSHSLIHHTLPTHYTLISLHFKVLLNQTHTCILIILPHVITLLHNTPHSLQNDFSTILHDIYTTFSPFLHYYICLTSPLHQTRTFIRSNTHRYSLEDITITGYHRGGDVY